MKHFRIAVNGTSYDVEVTELDGAVSAAAPAGDGTQVTAPMNGTIARVNCKVGDTVKADAAVIILEAMKMENEIYAGVDGTVKAVQVNTGDAVQPGDVLVVIG